MNPLLLDFPESLETERLLIRPLQRGDGLEMMRAINESLPELRPWMMWAQVEYTEDRAEDFCRRWQAKFLLREELAFFLFDKAQPEMQVGSCSLHHIDWEAHKFEIGYWLRTRYAGQGLMSEAVAALSRHTQTYLGAMRLEIRCDARNIASQRVAQRVGFVHEGTLRREALGVEGEWRDTMVFAWVREEWRSTP